MMITLYGIINDLIKQFHQKIKVVNFVLTKRDNYSGPLHYDYNFLITSYKRLNAFYFCETILL